MRLVFPLLPLAMLALACASAPVSKPADDDAGDGGASQSPLTPGTFSYVYANYFAPRSIGHCASSRCHGDFTHGGFQCGASKDDCYSGLTTNVITTRGRALVDPSTPLGSLIVDPKDSPLAWFSGDGTMPEDSPHANDKAKNDVLTWLQAGGAND